MTSVNHSWTLPVTQETYRISLFMCPGLNVTALTLVTTTHWHVTVRSHRISDRGILACGLTGGFAWALNRWKAKPLVRPKPFVASSLVFAAPFLDTSKSTQKSQPREVERCFLTLLRWHWSGILNVVVTEIIVHITGGLFVQLALNRRSHTPRKLQI